MQDFKKNALASQREYIMKLDKSHYSNYLISVQFDNGFMPDTLDGKIEQCRNFLDDLGNLAREYGKRLFATYSIVEGSSGTHAHFAVSWLPLMRGYLKTAKRGNKRIARFAVKSLLEQNFFYVDNPKEAIKHVTYDKAYVTYYVTEQPKDGQKTIFSNLYMHPVFVPTYSETKMRPYCSKAQIRYIRIRKTTQRKHIFKIFLAISILELFLISFIALLL